MSITPPSQTQQHVAPHLPPAEFVCDTAAEFEASLDELCVSLGLQATKMWTVARERCAELAELKRAALAIEARQIVRMAALKKVTAVIVDNKRAAEPPAAAPPASRRRMLVVASPPKAPFIRRRSVTLVETSLALAAARGGGGGSGGSSSSGGDAALDGGIAVFAAGDALVGYALDAASTELPLTSSLGANAIARVVYLPASNLVAVTSASEDDALRSSVRLFELRATSAITIVLHHHEVDEDDAGDAHGTHYFPVTQLASLHEGRTLAVGTANDGGIMLWHVAEMLADNARETIFTVDEATQTQTLNDEIVLKYLTMPESMPSAGSGRSTDYKISSTNGVALALARLCTPEDVVRGSDVEFTVVSIVDINDTYESAEPRWSVHVEGVVTDVLLFGTATATLVLRGVDAIQLLDARSGEVRSYIELPHLHALYTPIAAFGASKLLVGHNDLVYVVDVIEDWSTSGQHRAQHRKIETFMSFRVEGSVNAIAALDDERVAISRPVGTTSSRLELWCVSV